MIEQAESFSALALPGLVHGFTDRRGGVSSGPFATLNLGRGCGDDPAAVDENYRRLAQAGGFSLARLRTARQVHGRAVVRATEVDEATEADGLWCRRADAVVLAVRTADCVPVLLVDRAGEAAAAIHSGWMGTVLEIVPQAVAILEAAGISPSRLWAAIGPCIEEAAFEVGPEVAARFDERFVARGGYARPHVDLVAVVRDQLTRSGVPAEQIERVGQCTHQRRDLYFSYRRDRDPSGRQLSFVGFTSPEAGTP